MRGMNISNDQIWIQLSSAINEISISKELAKDIAEALNQVETKAHVTTKKQIEHYKLAEAELQVREDKLLDLRIAGEIDSSQYDSKLKSIRADRASITEQIEGLLG